MTEPPEPRHPEEGGGDDEMRGYEREDESLSADEWLANFEDDVLLDSIAQGVRGELGPDQLSELLSGLRDVPDAIDIPVPNTARVERGENVLPPRTQKGNTEPMTTSESIAVLNQVANDTSASGSLNEAASTMENTVLASAMQAVEQLAGLIGQALQAVDGSTTSQGEISSTGEHAAGAIEDAIEAIQAAISAVKQAQEHEATFRQTAGAAASRLSSS